VLRNQGFRVATVQVKLQVKSIFNRLHHRGWGRGVTRSSAWGKPCGPVGFVPAGGNHELAWFREA
jgi:hypothetical protein